MGRVLCLLVVAGIVSAPARGGDWPQFRGPTGQGLVPEGGLPLRWGEDKNVTWKVKIPGSGWSSPVIAGGRVYLTTAVPDGANHSLRALCLDAKSGKTLWDEEVFRADADAPAIHDKNSHASPSPIVDKDRLFVHFGHLGTACLDLAGKVLWRKQYRYRPVHGNGGTPTLAGGLLIFSCDGARQRFVVALDAKTGEERWKTERDVEAGRKFSFSTPLVIEVAGKRQVISPGSNMVAGYDLQTGKEIWRVRYTGYSVIPRPVFGHGLVFVGTGFNSPRLLAIRPTGKGDVTATHVAWDERIAVPHTPSLLLVGNELYRVSDRGVVSCVDARTGKQHWRERLPGAYSASPTYADGRIYFQNERGVCTVVAAGTTYRELARNTVDGRTFASFAVADGVLFLRSESHLYRIADK